MNAKKKLITMCAGLLATTMLLSACGSTPGGTSSSSTPSSESSSSTTSSTSSAAEEGMATDGIVFDDQGRFVKYDPPITLTTSMIVAAGDMFHDGCDAENNGWTQWMEEELGIKWELKWVAPDGETNTQKLDLAFASNDLPDAINDASVNQISKYAEAGKLTALDSFLEEAPPLVDFYVKDGLEMSVGAFWDPFTIDGKKYAMPWGLDSLSFWSVNFIRTDLLDTMGAEIPETISDLDALFAQYKEQYPNGHAMILDKNLTGMEIVTTAYEAYPNGWVEKDGKLENGAVQPEMKEALAKMAEWYQKGYIDPEFVVKDATKVNEDVVAGDFLMYNNGWTSIATPFTPMWNALPETTVEAIPFIKGDDGRCGIMKDTWWSGAGAISADCEHPEAFFYLFNDCLDSYYRNEEDLRQTMKDEYNYEFKYPVTEIQEPLNAGEVAEKYPNIGQPRQLYLYDYEVEGAGFMNDYYTRSWYGFTTKIPSLSNNDFGSMVEAYETGDTSGLTAEGENMYNEWNGTQENMLKTFDGIYNYWTGLMEDEETLHVNAYSGATVPTAIEKQSYLDKLKLETFTKIIMGTASIDSFGQFVEDWYANGGEQITQEVNEWYESNKK